MTRLLATLTIEYDVKPSDYPEPPQPDTTTNGGSRPNRKWGTPTCTP